MLIRPQRNFTVVRQLANHLDTATYYVRAVIRDAFTDDILATLDLDDKGGQRFSAPWVVAQDPSGEGRDISIVTSVYTDSGYTTKSDNYGDEENTHIIEDRRTSNGGGGAMGGGKLDSTRIRKIVAEEIAKIEFPKFEDSKDMFLEPLLEALSNVQEVVSSIEIPTYKEVDLKPVEQAIINVEQSISNVYKAVIDKEVTPAVDVSKIDEAVSGLKDANLSLAKNVLNIVKGKEDNVEQIIRANLQDMIIGEIKKVFSKIQFVISSDFLKVAEDQPEVIKETVNEIDKLPEIDINALAK